MARTAETAAKVEMAETVVTAEKATKTAP